MKDVIRTSRWASVDHTRDVIQHQVRTLSLGRRGLICRGGVLLASPLGGSKSGGEAGY